MKTFRPKLLDTMRGYTKSKLINDIVAGLIVAIIALPLSIALAIASEVPPAMGICTAIIAGFVIALFGGSSVNISGPTAAFATIVAGIVISHGISGLIVATVMAGIILILMGICHFGSLIKYIPTTITVGFTSGIAVTICIGQIKDFLGLEYSVSETPIETPEKLHAIFTSSSMSPSALLLGAIGLAILILWPMLGRARLGKFSLICSKIPASIIAVAVGILIVTLTPLDVKTIGSSNYDLSSSFKIASFEGITLDTVLDLIPSAFTIAILAAIESLLSCVVSDGMIGDRHNSNTELIAQGMGNVCSALFGGIPATGAIARTAANVKNGGRSPIAGITHALVLLIFLLFLMPVVGLIPMPIIAAILIMVAYNMSEWRHFVHICRHSPRSDVLVLVLTFALTVIFDLVVAIAVGFVLTTVLFMKKMSDVASVRRWDGSEESTDGHKKPIPEGTVVYELDGPMFFADADKLRDLAIDDGARVIIVRMSKVPSIDTSAIQNLEILLYTCSSKGVSLILSHTNESPMSTIKKSGLYEKIGEENFAASIDEALLLAEKICSQKEEKSAVL